MSERAKVTFYVEVTDPDHEMGITEEDYNRLVDGVMELGGEDLDVKKEAAKDA